MLKKSLLFMMLFALFGVARAQVTIGDLGEAVGNSFLPMNSLYNYSYTQQIYTADEIGMAGTINSITLWIYGNANLYEMPFDIYMVETDKDAFASTTDWETVTASDIVYSGTIQATHTDTLAYTFTLDVPFAYSGASNLLIAFNNTTGQWKGGFNGMVFGKEGDAVRSIYARQDSGAYDPYTPTFTAYGITYFRDVIELDITSSGGVVCDRPTSIDATLGHDPAHEVELTWAGGSGTYNLEYKKSSEDVWTAINNITTTTYELGGLTQNTAYTARVCSVCSDGMGTTTSGYRNASFTTDIACPTPEDFEVALTPGDGTTATFSWTETGTATTWQLCLDNDETNLIEMTTNPFTYDRFTPEQTYTAKMRAYCDAVDQSSWTNAVTFQPSNKDIIGSGTATSSNLPTTTCYNYSLTQQIYTAAELGAAGAILSIDFNSTNGATKARNFEIYMVNTNKSSFESTTDWITVTSSDLVYSATNYTWQTGWNSFDLDNPFIYDGTSNVAIVVHDQKVSSYECSVNFLVFEATGQSIYVRQDGADYDPLNTTSTTANGKLDVKNQIRLTKGVPPACPKPSGVVATVSGNQLIIDWTSDATSFNIDIDGNVTNGVTKPYTFTGDFATTYEVKVQANCGSDGLSEWTSATSFTTDACMPEDQCALTFVLADSYGDGWNTSAIVIYDYTGSAVGDVLATVTLESGSSDTLTVNFCNNQELAIIWESGSSWDSECSYTITDINGDIVAQDDTDLAIAYTMNCTITDCRRPSDFAASEIAPRSVKLGWTENGPATSWKIEYLSEHDSLTTIITVNTNPYTLTGLIPETMYAAQVTPVCDVDKPSEVLYWTTDVPCPAPSMTVTPYPTSAVVEWTGFGESYNLRYTTPDPTQPATVILSYPTAVWSDGSGYQMLLDADATAYGTTIPTSGGLTSSCTFDGTLYDVFEYKLPVDADASCDASNIVTAGNSVTIQIPAGTYDWCITNPSSGDRIWIASARGNVGGREDDFVFEGGMTYEFVVSAMSDDDGSGDGVTLNTSFDTSSWIEELTDVTSPYTITGLEPEHSYVVQIQSDCGTDGKSDWVSAIFQTPSTCDAPIDLETTNVTHNSATLSWTGYQDEYNLKYRETLYFTNFNTSADRTGWTWEGNIIYGLEDPILGYSSSDNYFLQMGWATTNETYIFSPELPELENDATLEFYHYYYSVANTFQIGYSSTTNDTIAFSWSDPIAAGNGYTLYSKILPAGTKYIAFKATASAQNACIFIDNFGIYPEMSETIVTTTAPTYDLTNLNPETTYFWQVQGVNTSCTGGLTDWSAVTSFTTEPITTVTQTISLSSGWNYFSSNVEITLDDLKAALVNALPGTAMMIKSKTGNCRYTGSTWRAAGLTSLDVAQMYKISVTADCEIQLTGMPINPADHPITIVANGNTYIGYPLSTSMTVANAFAGFGAISGDMVKSKTGNSRYTGTTWRAAGLTNLEPGQGYIYVSKSTEDRPFTFPTSTSKSAPQTALMPETTKADRIKVNKELPIIKK